MLKKSPFCYLWGKKPRYFIATKYLLASKNAKVSILITLKSMKSFRKY